MAKLKTFMELFYSLSDKKKSDILFQIFEQVDLVGEDDLDTLGCYILEILKKECLIFENNKLVTKWYKIKEWFSFNIEGDEINGWNLWRL